MHIKNRISVHMLLSKLWRSRKNTTRKAAPAPHSNLRVRKRNVTFQETLQTHGPF
jgi:hypothetical protein